MNLLLISSVNLTINPRIYKELQLASGLGYQITFIGFNLGNWSDAGDQLIKKKYPGIKFIYLEASRKKYFTWLYFSLLHIFYRFLWKFKKRSVKLSAFAHSKGTKPLLHLLNSLLRSDKYDLIVAHTLAALYPSAYIAKKYASNFAFDVEDFHPGEKIFKDAVNEKMRREIIMKNILSSASYVTAASGLISKNVEQLVPGLKVVTVLNYFPGSEFVRPVLSTGDKLKLVWFSQNINAGRGLELILSVWEYLKPKFEITLIGKIDNNFYKKYIIQHPDINIKAPISQNELHKSLSTYNIGLAIDIDNDDYNRKLAITNKILAYYQAGLYILATDTMAQQDFINEHPSHGVIIEQTSSSLRDTLIKMYSDKSRIRLKSEQRFIDASASSWEVESKIIKNEWDNIN